MSNLTSPPLPEGIRRALFERLENISDLNVELLDGAVQLEGVCDSLAQVRRASELVASLAGVHAVENLIAVEVPHPRSDKELQEAARNAAGKIDRRLEVDVADGVAVVRGQVERPALIDDAVLAVERVPGLKEVHCDVTFTQLTGGEGELRTALEQVIRAHSRYPGAVRVAFVDDSDVRLEGRMSSTEQRDRLLEAVRAVPGVGKVHNAIHLRPNKPEGAQGRHSSGERV